MRVLALDYGSARCGCAVSDLTGTLATPIAAVERPGTRKGLARLAELVRELRRQLTILIIEHDMKFLFGLADRISVIHWGQVIAQGTPDALRQNEWVARSNLGALA